MNVDQYKRAGTGNPVPPAESNRSVSILAPFPLAYLYAATHSPLKFREGGGEGGGGSQNSNIILDGEENSSSVFSIEVIFLQN